MVRAEPKSEARAGTEVAGGGGEGAWEKVIEAEVMEASNQLRKVIYITVSMNALKLKGKLTAVAVALE